MDLYSVSISKLMMKDREIDPSHFHWPRLPFRFRDKLGQLDVNGMEGIEIIGILPRKLVEHPRSIW